jgi:MoaA/NifB/PqqE/SkfB family radical SAM enzyme
MEKFFAITSVNADPFLITWDLGPRCNYDCSYCPSHRHDNFSPYASLEELENTADFLFSYISLISRYRNNKDFHVSFTGGEPTVNPNFIEFAKYIKKEYTKKYLNQFNLKLDLTTNGAMGNKICDAVIQNFDFVTVSYHAESNDKLKQQVKSRISDFAKSNVKLKVNVMFHSQYFDECKDLCSWLTSLGIRFIPRLIGEDPNSSFSQAHLYTADQRQWLKNFWNIDVSPLHRPCCGGRTFGVCSSEGTTETKSVNFRQFEGWSCSVNWYFLHIEQQSSLIYHHQTCQAKLDGTRGSIGDINNWQHIVTDLEKTLQDQTMPVIICPNKLCGCGLCTPKSKNRQDLLKTLPMIINDTSVFNLG